MSRLVYPYYNTTTKKVITTLYLVYTHRSKYIVPNTGDNCQFELMKWKKRGDAYKKHDMMLASESHCKKIYHQIMTPQQFMLEVSMTASSVERQRY